MNPGTARAGSGAEGAAAQRSPLVAPDGTRFRDLDHDGRMAPFEDPRLSVEERVQDLLPRLSAQEKVGLLFHTILGVGEPGDHDVRAGASTATSRQLVTDKLINHLNVHSLPSPRLMARWHNAVQDLAAQSPHGIPVTFSSDPRHAFTENIGVAFAATTLSQWPEQLGLAAIGSEQTVRDFADIARQEYRAMGLRAALHPQVDLATEARWARQVNTFGQDAQLSSQLVAAYLAGMQGQALDTSSVACMTKHFPGGGPQKDGEDPHFPYGREQVYPGDRFEEHLQPFRAAIAAGTSALMPYYGMPVGLRLGAQDVEEIAFAFDQQIITGLLRERLGYDGVVCTDWGLITDSEVFGLPSPARAWGAEHLDRLTRVARILEAGCDQFGGEDRTDLVLELLASGRLTHERLDASVRRLLRVKLALGLFDDPYVDEDFAEAVVGRADFRAAGHQAQAQSLTVLKNAPSPLAAPTTSATPASTLPLHPTVKVLVRGLEGTVASDYATVVEDPEDADIALVRIHAPYEERNEYFLESFFHQGSLDLPPDVVQAIRDLAARVPVGRARRPPGPACGPDPSAGRRDRSGGGLRRLGRGSDGRPQCAHPPPGAAALRAASLHAGCPRQPPGRRLRHRRPAVHGGRGTRSRPLASGLPSPSLPWR